MNMADIRAMELRTAEKLSEMFGTPTTVTPMTSDLGPVLSPRFSSTPRIKHRAASDASSAVAGRKLSLDASKEVNLNPERHYYQHQHVHQHPSPRQHKQE